MNSTSASCLESLRYVKDPATGNACPGSPDLGMDHAEVPELRIVDESSWQAAKARQQALLATQANAIAGQRANRLNPDTPIEVASCPAS